MQKSAKINEDRLEIIREEIIRHLELLNEDSFGDFITMAKFEGMIILIDYLLEKRTKEEVFYSYTEVL